MIPASDCSGLQRRRSTLSLAARLLTRLCACTWGWRVMIWSKPSPLSLVPDPNLPGPPRAFWARTARTEVRPGVQESFSCKAVTACRMPESGPEWPFEVLRASDDGVRLPSQKSVLFGRRGPLKGPRGLLKGSRGPLKGPRGPLKGHRSFSRSGRPGGL